VQVTISKQEEIMMKLMTRFELATKSTNELRGLYREIFNRLAGLQTDSMERSNALGSLQNIQNEL